MALDHITRVLKERNYAIFAWGFLCSGIGLQMLSTVVLWDLWQLTHDPLVLGLAGLARALPVIALALVAGHAADRHSRKNILGLTQAGFVLIALAFALASYIGTPIWTWYAILIASGCIRSFNGPSRNSLLPLLVKPDNFVSAVTWNAGIFQASAVTGPVLAGALLSWGVPSWGVFAVSAALILVLALLVPQLRPREEARASGAMTMRSMFAGMSHIWRERVILATLSLDLFGVLLGGAMALLPIYADEILGGGLVGFKDSPSRPVEQLSWNMVQPFCIQTGLRLPTEAEWEFACRASNTTPMYGPLNDIAWNVGNNPPYGTKAVATKLANALGFYDMIGNVWEWCQDRYGWYSSASVTDPQGPSSGSTRVIRGGSWGFGSSFCRASRRYSFTPNFVDEGGHGFRVARTP